MMDPTPTPRSPEGVTPPPGQAARGPAANDTSPSPPFSVRDADSVLPRFVEPTLPTRLESAPGETPESEPSPSSPWHGDSVHAPFEARHRFGPAEFEFGRPSYSIPPEEVERVAAVLEMLSSMLRSRGSQVVYGWGEPRDLESALQFYVKGYLLGRSEREKYEAFDG